HALTIRRFGRTVHMYAPLYLSNECLTTCTYCGFAKGLPIARKTLSVAQSLREGEFLRARGYRHVLLLTGEPQKLTGDDFRGQHEPWREDAIALAAHALRLLKVAWRQELAVSVPRIRPSASGYSPEHPVTDRELAQLICALRLVLPDTGIVMSTREAPGFRDA